MIISMIAAMGVNRVIGKNNSMMWHLPQEYQYFKNTVICALEPVLAYKVLGTILKDPIECRLRVPTP